MKFLAYIAAVSGTACDFETAGQAATGFTVSGTGTAATMGCVNVAGDATNSAAGKACDTTVNSNT